jgi:hypothetical protein
LFNWVFSGLLVGLGQVILLRKFISNLKLWILVTSVSFAFGISVFGKVFILVGLAIALFNSNSLSSFISGGMFGIFNGCVMGIPVGFAQWLILRRQVKYSSGWILANFLGLMLGGTLGFIVVGTGLLGNERIKASQCQQLMDRERAMIVTHCHGRSRPLL